MAENGAMLQQVGVTQAGLPVVAGVFRSFETYGLPLDVILSSVRDAGMLPCWRSFCNEATAAGMKLDRVLAKLDEALSDSYGVTFRDHVLAKLRSGS